MATSIFVYNRLLFICIHLFINVTCNNEHIITVFHTIYISIYFCCKITTLIVMVNSMYYIYKDRKQTLLFPHLQVYLSKISTILILFRLVFSLIAWAYLLLGMLQNTVITIYFKLHKYNSYHYRSLNDIFVFYQLYKRQNYDFIRHLGFYHHYLYSLIIHISLLVVYIVKFDNS